MPSIEMQQIKQLNAAPLYEAVKVGRKWKAKTPAGVLTRRTKKSAQEAADAWRRVNQEADKAWKIL